MHDLRVAIVLRRVRFQSGLLDQWTQFASGPEISIHLLLG